MFENHFRQIGNSLVPQACQHEVDRVDIVINLISLIFFLTDTNLQARSSREHRKSTKLFTKQEIINVDEADIVFVSGEGRGGCDVPVFSADDDVVIDQHHITALRNFETSSIQIAHG